MSSYIILVRSQYHHRDVLKVYGPYSVVKANEMVKFVRRWHLEDLITIHPLEPDRDLTREERR